MDGLFSRGELTRWRRVVRFRLFVFGRPPSERRRKRLAGQPGGARGGRRRSGASVVAAWLAASVGACGVGVLLARRCPGKRHGAFAAPPAPHRPQTLPARLCEAACPAPWSTYGRERRRARAPAWGRFTRCSSGGAGARERRDAPRCAWPPWDCGRCPGKRHGALPLSPGAATRSSREAARGGRCKRAKIWNCQNKRSMVSLVSSYKPSVTALHKRIATVDSPQKRSPRLMHHEV